MSQMVYFAQCKATGAVKIGYSASLERRLKALGTVTPEGVSLLYSIPGGWELEQAIHDELEDIRQNGEWFACQQALKDLIHRLRTEGANNVFPGALLDAPKPETGFDYADLLPRLVMEAASPPEPGDTKDILFHRAARRSGLSHAKCFNVFYGRSKTLNIEDFQALKAAALKHTNSLEILRLLMSELAVMMQAVVDKAEILKAEQKGEK